MQALLRWASVQAAVGPATLGAQTPDNINLTVIGKRLPLRFSSFHISDVGGHAPASWPVAAPFDAMFCQFLPFV